MERFLQILFYCWSIRRAHALARSLTEWRGTRRESRERSDARGRRQTAVVRAILPRRRTRTHWLRIPTLRLLRLVRLLRGDANPSEETRESYGVDVVDDKVKTIVAGHERDRENERQRGKGSETERRLLFSYVSVAPRPRLPAPRLPLVPISSHPFGLCSIRYIASEQCTVMHLSSLGRCLRCLL